MSVIKHNNYLIVDFKVWRIPMSVINPKNYFIIDFKV